MTTSIYSKANPVAKMMPFKNHTELDLFLAGLLASGIDYHVYDAYDDMQIDAKDKPEATPFSWDILVVPGNSYLHYFFSDGKLQGSAHLEFA
jgi:hypothetical protein